MKINIVNTDSQKADKCADSFRKISNMPFNLVFTIEGRAGFFQRVRFGEPLEKSKLIQDVVSRGDHFLMNLTTGTLVYLTRDHLVSAVYEMDGNAFKIWDKQKGFCNCNSEQYFKVQKSLSMDLSIFPETRSINPKP